MGRTNRIYSLILFIFFCILSGFSQELNNYSVSYEKKINLKNLFKGENDWFNKKDNKFYIDSFYLITNSEESNYTKLEDAERREWFSTFMTYSTVYRNISKHQIISQREISDATLVIRDSIRDFKWKMTFETRTIAGFECYKALGKLNDTTDIVAFFTPQLHASIGPETIGGLPGTILGLVVPKLHTTWLAKQVTNLEIKPPTTFTKSFKGRETTREAMMKELTNSFKEFTGKDLILLRLNL